jgi:hypothetical protein
MPMIAREFQAEAAADMARAKALGPVQRFGKSGRLSLRIPMDAFYRAIENNGGVSKDGKTCWDDPEFRGDMIRHHPHIATTEAGHVHLSFAQGQRGAPRNRFGRVKERIVYGNGGKRVEVAG